MSNAKVSLTLAGIIELYRTIRAQFLRSRAHLELVPLGAVEKSG